MGFWGLQLLPSVCEHDWSSISRRCHFQYKHLVCASISRISPSMQLLTTPESYCFWLGYSCMFAQSANVCCTAAHSKLLLLSRPCMKRSWQLQRALTQGLRLLLHFFSRRPDERWDSMRVDEETTMGRSPTRNKEFATLHCLKIRHQSIRLFVLASQRPSFLPVSKPQIRCSQLRHRCLCQPLEGSYQSQPWWCLCWSR